MSNRLESLNSKASKPALKFKPKVVARKSKEDREKEAKEIKAEQPTPRGPPTRGRGGARGGRGGRGGALAGTHMVSAGPLSMGSVALTELKATKMSYHSQGTFNASSDLGSTAFLSKMTLKTRSNVPTTNVDSDEEDHKASRINMNKEYAYEESETILFPVRPEKDAEATPDAIALALESVLAVLSAPQSRAQSRALTVDSVKSEATDGVAPELPPIADVAGDLARAEHDRLIDDQRSIMDLITSKVGDIKTEDATTPENKYLVFQMPQIQPTDYKPIESKSSFASGEALVFDGSVGNLNFHKSGKISITMNDGSILECTKGTNPSFLQEVYMLDSLAAQKTPEELETDGDVFNANNVKVGGSIFRLGQVVGKVVAMPRI
ncbi:hypothetical protein PUMCH_000596 [Australozyma saopauloensis]|uniref:DNA-directed RNA polymerase III subunit RPC4 n=1 Tax=Australozyma saopauloensis TaxID=291208 RepID=A0AAX4H4K0_9ASCO|nr:hypothetical protein PUMCH_000596 [[Candida] saopauloensis]